jgi:N-glycosylase/DNA lyase
MCGQCFRWQEIEDGVFCGVVNDKSARIWQTRENIFLEELKNCNLDFWSSYFALNRDYEFLETALKKIPVLKLAYKFSPGIRILKQDPWETLISFIISQNNNIKRIKGLIDKLCRLAGTPIDDEVYAFPSAEQLANLTLEDLKKVGVGFRARYILSAANRVLTGRLELGKLGTKSSDFAKAALMKIDGVGPKIAACVLLYGFGRYNVAPVDVWIRRGLLKYFPNGWPREFEGFEGIAQQYLYNYLRKNYEPG